MVAREACGRWRGNDYQDSPQDSLSGGYILAKVRQIALNIAFQHFLSPVSGDKSSLSGGKNYWVVVEADHSRPVCGEPGLSNL